jgi:hypothetical protein
MSAECMRSLSKRSFNLPGDEGFSKNARNTINIEKGNNMKVVRSQLIQKIIYKRLATEVDKLRSIANQGFDIHALSPFPEVIQALQELLEYERKENESLFHIMTSAEQLFQEECIEKDMEDGFIPTILMSNETLACGMGFVKYELPTPDELLHSVPTAIEEILEHFGLNLYIEIFDSQKLRVLKQIAKRLGIRKLIDCVVQTAYLAGFQGNQKDSQKYLEATLIQEDSHDTTYRIPLESCAKKFLSHVILQGEHAHAFLKSCLSYYIITDQGHTMSRASQILSISRTTLQEHLRLASELGVSHFFDGKLN